MKEKRRRVICSTEEFRAFNLLLSCQGLRRGDVRKLTVNWCFAREFVPDEKSLFLLLLTNASGEKMKK